MLSRLSLTAFAIPLVLVLGIGGISSAEESLYDPDVVLVMKDKVLSRDQRGTTREPFAESSLLATSREGLVILLRNEDNVAHEFVSPLLLKAEDLQLSGRATLVYTITAVGVRVEPRDSVTLRFDIPDAGFDQFHFWCNIHGKFVDDSMRGEIFILRAKPSSQ